MVPSIVDRYISVGFFEVIVTAATFLSSFPTTFQDAPASVLLKRPSRMATNMILGSSGFTAKPFTVRLVGRPPTKFHPQKQSALRCRPVEVPAYRNIPPMPVEMFTEVRT